MLLTAVLLLATPEPIHPVDPALRARLSLSTRYQKSLDANGLPILGSGLVADAALREARLIATSMLVNHPEYLRTLAQHRVRLVVMAPTELTTDVPEHSDLTPKDYWDRRARGLGATDARPAVSCAEENLLEEPGDPYAAENICVHEFAHAVHEMALVHLVPDFNERLHAAFLAAQEKGTWKNTYAMTNEHEYWAEAVQSWFDTNRHDDAEHGSIDTREEVQQADPQMAALITSALGDVAWRYRRPSARPPAERALLGAFPAPLPRFAWPERLKPRASPANQRPELSLQPMAQVPARSPATTAAVALTVVNHTAAPLAWDWVDFRGARKRYATISPGASFEQSTFEGHVWVLSQGTTELGWVVAPGRAATLTVAATP